MNDASSAVTEERREDVARRAPVKEPVPGGLRRRARDLRRDAVALWLAARDPRVPWPAKAVALAVAAYALSPIDLVPDFIPVLGLLDDLLIVPAGILLARHLVPASLLDEHRRAAEALLERPRSRLAALVIVLVWLALLVAVAAYGWSLLAEPSA
jgi:uncharacterized membrane protein YkvA (DUF1232 family)